MISTMRALYVASLAAAAVVALAACGGRFMGSDEAEYFDAPAAPAAAPAPAFAAAGVAVEERAARAAFAAPAALAPPIATAPPVPAAAIKADEAFEVGDELTSSEEDVAALVTQQRIIVRTVDIQLVVAEVSASLDDVAELAKEFQGWVVSSSRSQKHRGFISIRVPAERLDDAVRRLRDMAVEVESEDSTSKDVTDEYFDTKARLENLQATEEALRRLFDRAENVEDALKVQQSLTQVQEDIERLQGRIKFLEQTSAFSLINVTLGLEPADMAVDAGTDQTAGVGEVVRFRAFFKPPEGMEEFFFTWDFGDGSRLVSSDRTAPTEDEDTRVTATVTHQYRDERDSPFFAEVKVTGTGEAGLAEGEDLITVTVTRIPAIEVFAGDSITVEEGEEVDFSGSFTRPEGVTDLKYRWVFGDGTVPVTGEPEEGATNAVATHVYPNYRPFPFTATLTVTGQSDAGEAEASSSVGVRVVKSSGWVIAGWSPGDAGKSGVRALSGVGQVMATGLIWAGIFSPVWVILGVVVVLAWRRIRGARRRKAAEASE